MRLYKGFQGKCWKCKAGVHKKLTFRRKITIEAIEKYPLLSQQIKYYFKHGWPPQDEERTLYACTCQCGCGKEFLRKIKV